LYSNNSTVIVGFKQRENFAVVCPLSEIILLIDTVWHASPGQKIGLGILLYRL